MSRIAGLLSFQGSDPDVARQRFERMSTTLGRSHLEPPSRWQAGMLSVALTTTRDAGGGNERCFYRDADQDLWVWFDGIMFRSTGIIDTSSSGAENLAAAYLRWGENCFARVSGAYAAVVFDGAKQRLMLATDHFGSKPLNYHRRDDDLAFASEYRPLISLLERMQCNRRVVLEFVMHGEVLPPASLILDLCTVPAGHFLSVNLATRQSNLVRYHDPVDVVDASNYMHRREQTAAELIDELESQVNRSVAENMASGGPFGVAMSGGVDSATIAAIAHRHGEVRAVHVSVPEGANFDERPMAEAIARHVGIDMSVISLKADMWRKNLVAATLENEMPLWHLQNVGYYLLCQRAREMGIRTILSGDTLGMMLSPASQLPWLRLGPLLKMAHALPASVQTFLQKFGYALGGLPLNSHGFSRYLPLAVQLTDGYGRTSRTAGCEEAYRFVTDLVHRRLHGAKLAEVHDFYNRFFYRGDRLGNAHGIEFRTPFGDIDALRFSMNLPYEFLVREGTPKWGVKALGNRYLPRAICFQKKVPWDMPGDTYVGCYGVRRFFENGFCDQILGVSGPGLDSALAHWHQDHHRLSRMVCLEIWGRLYILGQDPAELQQWLSGFDS